VQFAIFLKAILGREILMDWPLTIGITTFFTAVFTVLGFWHRTIQRAHDQRLTEMISDAEQQGLNQALTQHPHIDRYRCLGCGSCVRACPEKGVLALVEGKSCMVHASHCVGHGCCEQACPVGALTVGLGDTSSRPDIPILSKDMETSVPGVFIAGELGGIGLIYHAINQGIKVIETIAGQLHKNKIAPGDRDIIDVLIIGCGPAGVAAALKALELGLSYTLIAQDDVGGTVRKYPRKKLVLTQPVDLPMYGRMKRTQYMKEELIELWESIFLDMGIEFQPFVKFTDLDLCNDGSLLATTSAGVFHCRNLVLVLGRRGTPRRLGVPGEASERVLYQLVDATDYTHQDLLVVGGGDSAIEAAQALAAQPGNRVTLSYRRHTFFRIKQRNRERIESLQQDGKVEILFNSRVKKIESSQVLLAIETEDGGRTCERIIPAEHVFVFAGGEPPYPLLRKIGVRFGGASDSEEQAEIEPDRMSLVNSFTTA
jgi:thioredoxin reductase/Pyruvate/2-oxoacid:ferredoxin oxidoreductase delta subunit